MRAPESFFDDYPVFKMNAYPLMEEIKLLPQEPTDICRDYFYRCLTEPKIRAMIDRQPFTLAAITTRLVSVLKNFKSRIGDLVEECGKEIEATLIEQMKEIDGFYGQQRPFLEALLTRRVQPFVDRKKREGLNASLTQVGSVVRDLIWQPLADIEDEVKEPESDHQSYDSGKDSSSQDEPEDVPLDIHEINFRSFKRVAIVSELSTINFTFKGHSDKAKIIKIEAKKLLADAYKIATDIKLALPVLDDTNAQKSKAILKSYCERLRSPIYEVVSRFHASIADHNRLKLDITYLSHHSTAIARLHNSSTKLGIIIDNHDQYCMQNYEWYRRVIQEVARRKGKKDFISFVLDLRGVKYAINQFLSAFPAKYHN